MRLTTAVWLLWFAFPCLCRCDFQGSHHLLVQSGTFSPYPSGDPSIKLHPNSALRVEPTTTLDSPDACLLSQSSRKFFFSKQSVLNFSPLFYLLKTRISRDFVLLTVKVFEKRLQSIPNTK